MKQSVFIMEVENGVMVEQPNNGKKWFYTTLEEAMAQATELMTPKEIKPLAVVESPE